MFRCWLNVILIDEIEIWFEYASLENKRHSNNSDTSVRNTLLFSHFGVSITGIIKLQSPHALANSSYLCFSCYPYRCPLWCLWLVLNAEQWQTPTQLERTVRFAVLSSSRELLPWIPASEEDWGALSTCLLSGLTSVSGKANNEHAASFISNGRLIHTSFVFTTDGLCPRCQVWPERLIWSELWLHVQVAHHRQ